MLVETLLPTPSADVTGLLSAWQSGDRAALARLMPVLYDDLRRIAQDRLRRVAPGQTLSTCALVHEGYERIAGSQLSLVDRNHFLALMSRVMRNVLVDRAMANNAQRRGGDAQRVDFEQALAVAAESDAQPELLDLHEALQRLGQLDPRKEQIVELSFFGGMTRPEIAEAMDVSRATVDRELRMAMAWLKAAIGARMPATSPR